MTAIATPPAHRVSRAVAGMHAVLDGVTDASVWSLDSPATTTTLDELQRLTNRVAELHARVLAHADQLKAGDDTGATSTANWLAHHTKLTRREAHRQVRLAHALETYDATRAALAEGRLHVDQASVITQALDDLPEDLDPTLVDEAEAHLIAEAAHFDATALKRISRRLMEVVAPDLADAHEAKLLEREEREAAAACRLTMSEDGHGKVHGRFTLDALHGAMLKKALLAFAAPKHRASQGPLGQRRPTPERMGRALCELIERYPTNKLPKAGGINATVVVLMQYESLIGGLKAAKLDTGEVISASLARRLACEAGIIPAVLDGKSRVLDLGRKRRFHSDAQRIAKIIEQGGVCIAENCDAPAGLAHMHHPIAWSQGGRTDRDGWLICPPHHTRAHDPTFTITKLPNGKVAFTRRT